MSKSLKRVRAALRDLGLDDTVMEMPGETRTAADAAREAGCAIDQIAKSIIFKVEGTDEIVLFLTAGGNQVDLAKAAATVGRGLARADAAVVRASTGFAIGGVSPIGHLTAPKIYYDPRLSDFDVVYAAAGTPRHIFPINPLMLREVISAEPADFTV